MGFLRKREDENGNAKVIAAVIHLIMTIIIVAAIFGLVFVVPSFIKKRRTKASSGAIPTL